MMRMAASIHSFVCFILKRGIIKVQPEAGPHLLLAGLQFYILTLQRHKIFPKIKNKNAFFLPVHLNKKRDIVRSAEKGGCKLRER
jgi:hypothetical protein